MRLLAVVSLVSVLVGSTQDASAKPHAAPPPVAAGRIQSLSLPEAAQFLSRLYHAQVVVLGGSESNVSLDLDGLDQSAAIAHLAKAAGLHMVRSNAIYVIAPREIVATALTGRRGLPAGERITLDFVSAEAPLVFRLLAAVLKLAVDGTVRGRVSVFGQDFGSLELVGVLSRLSGREASRHAGRLLVSGAFPDSPQERAPPACAPDAAHSSFLQCVDASELEAEAWGRLGDRTQVALRTKTPVTEVVLVRVGDAVGKALTPVKEIDARGVLLGDGTLIALPESAAAAEEK